VSESVRAFYERTHDGFGLYPHTLFGLYELGRVRPVYDVLDLGYEELEAVKGSARRPRGLTTSG